MNYQFSYAIGRFVNINSHFILTNWTIYVKNEHFIVTNWTIFDKNLGTCQNGQFVDKI